MQPKCYRGVTVVSQECYQGVTRVLQEYRKVLPDATYYVWVWSVLILKSRLCKGGRVRGGSVKGCRSYDYVMTACDHALERVTVHCKHLQNHVSCISREGRQARGAGKGGRETTVGKGHAGETP
jgi:hypothetical protein